MGQEREKKILVPNSVLARFGKENSEKYSKKIPKIKKPFSISILTQPDLEIFKKKSKKIQKIKYLIPALFLSKTG